MCVCMMLNIGSRHLRSCTCLCLFDCLPATFQSEHQAAGRSETIRFPQHVSILSIASAHLSSQNPFANKVSSASNLDILNPESGPSKCTIIALYIDLCNLDFVHCQWSESINLNANSQHNLIMSLLNRPIFFHNNRSIKIEILFHKEHSHRKKQIESWSKRAGKENNIRFMVFTPRWVAS